MTTRDAKGRGTELAQQLVRSLFEDYPHLRDAHTALAAAALALRTAYLRAVAPAEGEALDVELRYDTDGGALDDLVIRTPQVVRLERMDDKVWWLRIEVLNRTHAVVLYLSSATRIDVTVEHD